jgi:hypothetical protein
LASRAVIYDASFTNITTNYATTASLSSYATTASLSSYATTASLSSYATTASLSSYVQAGTNNDLSLNGNVQLGGGVKNISINKLPNASFALDVSGASQFTGNLTVLKRASDTNYSYFDMSFVNLGVHNVSEKYASPSYSAGNTSLTLDYSQGGLFYVSGVTANITSISITNVPTTVGRTVSITLMLAPSAAATWYYTAVGSSLTINGGAAISPLKASGYAVPSAASNMVIHQFVIIWAGATPTVLVYISNLTT